MIDRSVTLVPLTGTQAIVCLCRKGVSHSMADIYFFLKETIPGVINCGVSVFSHCQLGKL